MIDGNLRPPIGSSAPETPILPPKLIWDTRTFQILWPPAAVRSFAWPHEQTGPTPSQFVKRFSVPVDGTYFRGGLMGGWSR
jgi:hypothetical protein